MARRGGAFKPAFLLSEEEGLAIVKEAIPEADDGFAGYVLWNETGFPEFWHIPKDGQTPAECCCKQVKRYVRRSKRKEQ